MLVQVKRNKVGLEYLENVLKEWGRWGMLSHRITYKRNRQDHKEKMRGHTIYGKVSGENRWEHYMDSVLHLARASSSQFRPVWKKSEKVVGEFWKFFFLPPQSLSTYFYFFFFQFSGTFVWQYKETILWSPNAASHTCSNWTWLFRASQAKTTAPTVPEIQGWLVFWLFWGFFCLLSSLLQFPHLVKLLRTKICDQPISSCSEHPPVSPESRRCLSPNCASQERIEGV